jgi:hypothetical protein
MSCGGEKLVIWSESANDVFAMASAIALTNSFEHLNKTKCRAMMSRDILYWPKSTMAHQEISMTPTKVNRLSSIKISVISIIAIRMTYREVRLDYHA